MLAAADPAGAPGLSLLALCSDRQHKAKCVCTEQLKRLQAEDSKGKDRHQRITKGRAGVDKWSGSCCFHNKKLGSSSRDAGWGVLHPLSCVGNGKCWFLLVAETQRAAGTSTGERTAGTGSVRSVGTVTHSCDGLEEGALSRV